MSHSNAFVNVLLCALSDGEFCKELNDDVVAALKKKEMGEDLTENEMEDLKKIFEKDAVVGQARPAPPPGCGYRGY